LYLSAMNSAFRSAQIARFGYDRYQMHADSEALN